MNSTAFTWIIIGEFIAAGGMCFYERNYPKAMYWLCAAGLNFAILYIK